MLFKDMAIWGFQVTTSHQRCWGCHSKLTNWPPKKKNRDKNFQVDGFKSFFTLHEEMIPFDSLFFQMGWNQQQDSRFEGGFPYFPAPHLCVQKKNSRRWRDGHPQWWCPKSKYGALNALGPHVTGAVCLVVFFFFFGWKNWQQQKTNMFYLPKKSFFGGQVLHRFLLVGNVFCCGFLPLFFRTKKGVVLIGGPSVEDFCNKKTSRCTKKGAET